MRGHDQTSGRGRHRAWAWLVLLVVPAWAAGAAARAFDEPAPGFASPAADPIDLAADRIREWTAGAEHWAVLEGQAAVLQGVDGVRAQRVVIKDVPSSRLGKVLHRVEVYAEGKAQTSDRPGQSTGQLRLTLTSEPGLVFKPYEKRGLEHAKGPPADAAALLRRAFPPPVPQPATPISPIPGQRSAEPKPLFTPLASDRGGPGPDSKRPQRPPEPERPSVVPGLVPSGSLVQAAPAAASPTLVSAAPESTPKVDPAVRRAQFGDEGFPELPAPAVELPQEPQPPAETPGLPPAAAPGELNGLEPLPNREIMEPPAAASESPAPASPVIPYSQRSVSVFPRDAGTNFKMESLGVDKNGVQTVVVQGGVTIVVDDRPGALQPEKRGTVDLSADNVVIWKGPAPPESPDQTAPEGGEVEDGRKPLEVYLEGNVVFRQDQRLVAGNGDQKVYRASRAYYDFRTERFIALDAELNVFSSGLIAPMKMTGPQIQQFAPVTVLPDGRTVMGRMHIYSDHTRMTGSRFPNPGYKFTSQSIDMTEVIKPLANPRTGTPVAQPGDPNQPQDKSWLIDARQNVFFMGPVPVFYWPRFLADPEDLDPPLRNITPRFNNYFGQQLLSDWNGFKLFNLQKPKFFMSDNWNVDIDYLSRRKSAAIGSEYGYFGSDLFSDIYDEFNPDKNNPGFKRSNLFPNIQGNYFGYLDFWGLDDHATDVLGTGPAIVTNGPKGAGKAGYQRTGVPPFQQFRGRFMFRHMQSLNGPDALEDEDFRLELETGYISDRHFLEQYYQNLFNYGADQETLAYMIRQHQNSAWTILTEANLQNWYTDTQWAPKVDYYRLGDSLLGNRFTYFSSTGVDWANTHTAVEVNNPNLFAFIPYDPVSNTSGPLRTGRAYTSQELDLPINLEVIRIVPYVQGQLVGWNNQLGGQMVGRVWGAAGARANVMMWKLYPDVQSELFNVHGLNHKITFDADYRDSFSNVHLNEIGVQDDLDDNTYEFVRRYFALTNYVGGILPMQYDPRFLLLRRAISPIAGSTDLQASMNLLQMGIHQRLQTKRGPEGKRRVIDYMVLDVTTTYFPFARRDNFGKSFGQNMYNWEWYVGDRTSLYSYGWFEFFDITGQAILKTTPRKTNDPFGFKVISSGIAINRPPRGTINIGYSIINTGTIATSALNFSYSYWLSPKWYGAFSTSYDFGNGVPLGTSFAFTRIGADYLTTIGLSVDPQRLNSFNFGFEIAPRLSPNIRLGSTAGLFRFDSRFAPTQ